MSPLQISAEQLKDQRVCINGAGVPLGCIPFLIGGVVPQWEATSRWTPDLLKEACGTYEVSCSLAPEDQPVFFKNRNPTQSFHFSTFVDKVFKNRMPDDHRYDLRIDSEHPVFKELSIDFTIPEFLEGDQACTTEIWIGQRGNVRPFHHDWSHSFFAQVRGRKRFRLASFLEGEVLQRTWPLEAQYDFQPAPIMSGADSQNQLLTTSYEGVLEPGHMLYIPPYWYHQFNTLDNGNITVSMGVDTPLSPHIPLLQLCQNSVLLAYTNEQINDTEELVKGLNMNRELFAKKEEDFVRAFVKSRCPEEDVNHIKKRLEPYPRRKHWFQDLLQSIF